MRNQIPVVFRAERSGKFKGDVTAVLPTLATNFGHWVCYAHIGQHSECSRDWYYSTRAAKPAEYADLLAELKSIGYDVRVYQRISRDWEQEVA